MKAFQNSLVLALVLLGCSSEPEKKPATGKKTFLELKIQSPAVRSITIDGDGGIADILSPLRVAGKLNPDDLKALKSIATSVEWDKIPVEGFTTAAGKPVEGGRTYDLTYGGLAAPRVVHSMDGAAEVASFTRLREAIEIDANKIGK